MRQAIGISLATVALIVIFGLVGVLGFFLLCGFARWGHQGYLAFQRHRALR